MATYRDGMTTHRAGSHPMPETEDVITITYEDGRQSTLRGSGASLLHLAGSGALDLLIDAHEPFRRDPDEAP